MSKKSRAKKTARASKPAKPTSRTTKKATRKPAGRTSSKVKPARKSPAKRVATAPATRELVSQALDFLRFTTRFSDDQLNALPDEHALAQLAGANNHKAWTLGHQALSRAWFASSISGTMPQLPESYQALFGMKSLPSSDPGMYPPLDELRANYSATLDAMITAIERLTDADLAKPAFGDSGGWLTSRLDAILKAAWHEGWHGGQVATLRRGLGLPGLM